MTKNLDAGPETYNQGYIRIFLTQMSFCHIEILITKTLMLISVSIESHFLFCKI